jgi:uncharacterized membrane protein
MTFMIGPQLGWFKARLGEIGPLRAWCLKVVLGAAIFAAYLSFAAARAASRDGTQP